MANLVFAFPNYADVDYYTPVLSGGGWSGSLPLANLQDKLLSLKARSGDAALASTLLHADLGVQRDLRLMSLHGHNFSRSARVRFRASREIAFSGVRLAANASSGAGSISVECPDGSAMIRAGQTFTLNGTVYKATSDLGLGGNYQENSEDLTHGNYTKAEVTVSANAATAPDGTATADLVTESTATAAHRIEMSGTYAYISPGLRVTGSVFAKPNGSRNLRLTQYDPAPTSNTAYVDFDLANGTILASSATGGAAIVAFGIEALPDGWFRVWMSVERPGLGGSSVDWFYYTLLDAAGNDNYAGDGESGVYLWGGQVEAGSLSTYVRSGDPEVKQTASGSINISPNLAANATAGDALTAVCGEYVSTAPALDSGFEDVWPVVYTWPLAWEHPSFWDGKVTEEDRQNQPKDHYHLNAATVNARYALIEIEDTANAAGYVEAGRLFLSRGIQPPRNFSYSDPLIGWETDTEVKKSLGGAEFADRREPYRVMSLKIENLSKDAALQELYEMFRSLGKDGQVFCALNPDETTHKKRLAMLGRMTQLQPIGHPAHNNYTAYVTLKEVIA